MWLTNGGETQPSGGLHLDHLDQDAGPRAGKYWWKSGGTPPVRMARQTISGYSDGGDGRKSEPIRELPSVSE